MGWEIASRNRISRQDLGYQRNTHFVHDGKIDERPSVESHGECVLKKEEGDNLF